MDKLYDKSWAFVISVGKLSDHKAPYKDIPNTKNDAKAIEDLLVNHCNFPRPNIYYLYDDDATLEKIDEKIEDTLPQVVNKGDRLLIFYAGHAITRPARGHRVDEEGYIIPYDAKWKSKKEPKWPTMKSFNSLIKQVNDNIKANQILFLLDCCFSGIAHKPPEYDNNEKTSSANMIRATKNQSVQIITASSKDEPVIDSGKVPTHSIFTQTILEFIPDEKAFDYGEGFISARKMAKKIQHIVVAESYAWGNGRTQEPKFYRSDFDKLGEFVVKQFSEKELAEKRKEDKFVITKNDELIGNADLITFVNTNDIIVKINKELKEEPEKQLTASAFLTLIKKKIKQDETVMGKIRTMKERQSLTNEQVKELLDGLSLNILIHGVKVPMVHPLIPSEEIMVSENKEQMTDEETE